MAATRNTRQWLSSLQDASRSVKGHSKPRRGSNGSVNRNEQPSPKTGSETRAASPTPELGQRRRPKPKLCRYNECSEHKGFAQYKNKAPTVPLSARVGDSLVAAQSVCLSAQPDESEWPACLHGAILYCTVLYCTLAGRSTDHTPPPSANPGHPDTLEAVHCATWFNMPLVAHDKGNLGRRDCLEESSRK